MNDKKPSQKQTDVVATKLSGFQSIEEMKDWAVTIINSGLLPTNISTPEQVITIVQHGKELGLSPHVALNNIHVIQGRPTVSSAMLGAMLKRANIEWNIIRDFEEVPVSDSEVDYVTEYTFFWKSKVTNKVLEASHSVSWNQLEMAGYTTKQNYEKYPKEMLRARCLSSAVRAYFPEILLGMYTDLEINDISPDEAEVIVDEHGEVILNIKETKTKSKDDK